jgi:hypothetical protein
MILYLKGTIISEVLFSLSRTQLKYKMDFSHSNDVIEQKTPSKSPSKKDSFTKKHVNIQLQLLLVLTKDDEYYPLGFKVSNSFQLKELLEYQARFPCDSSFPAHARILFHDKVRDTVNNLDFSPALLEKYSLSQLQSTSWLQNGVITLVTDEKPENVMSAYALVQTLDKQVLFLYIYIHYHS